MILFRDVSDDIRGCITTIRERAAGHSSEYVRNETATRVQLINPLLKALGWDIESPSDVRHERKITAGKLDYALHVEGQMVGILEAKSRDVRMGSVDHSQIIKYVLDPDCKQLQVVAMTNSNDWIVYRKTENWSPQRVDISAGESFKAAFELFELFHMTHFVANGQNGGVWHKLSPDLRTDRKPRAVRFDKGPTIRVNSWRSYWVEVAKYLVLSKAIEPSDMPLSISRNGSYLMNRLNRRKDGRPFRHGNPIAADIWMETHGSGQSILKDSIRLLRQLGIDPSLVEISFDDLDSGNGATSGGTKVDNGASKQGSTGSQGAGASRHWIAISDSIPSGKSPAQIRFDGGESQAIGSWRDVFEAVASFLIASGRIKLSDAPIKITAGSRYAIHREPVHENGTPFAAKRQVGGGLWAETNNSARDTVKYAAELMRIFGGQSHLCELKLP